MFETDQIELRAMLTSMGQELSQLREFLGKQNLATHPFVLIARLQETVQRMSAFIEEVGQDADLPGWERTVADSVEMVEAPLCIVAQSVYPIRVTLQRDYELRCLFINGAPYQETPHCRISQFFASANWRISPLFLKGTVVRTGHAVGFDLCNDSERTQYFSVALLVYRVQPTRAEPPDRYLEQVKAQASQPEKGVPCPSYIQEPISSDEKKPIS